MATGLELMTAMMGQRYKPVETGYGIGAQAIAGALPSVVSPYASSGQNIASVLGGALVAGLLGYQARKEADERNILQSRLMSEALTGVTPARRQEIIEQDPRLASTLGMLDLQRISQARELSGELAKARMLAGIDVDKQRAIETGRPFGETVQPSAEGESLLERSYGKTGEQQIEKAKARLQKVDAFKNFGQTERNLRRLSEVFFDPSGVSSLEFIFAAAKAMDPDSVVREGEQIVIKKSGGPIEALRSSINQINQKGALTMKQKSEIMDLVSGTYRVNTDQIQNAVNAEGTTLSRQLGITNKDEIEARKKELLGGLVIRPFNDIINQYARVSEGKTPKDVDFASLIDQIRAGKVEGDSVIEGLKQQWSIQQGRDKQLQPDQPQSQAQESRPITIASQIESAFADPAKQGQATTQQQVMKSLLKKKQTAGLTPEEEAQLSGALQFFGLVLR